MLSFRHCVYATVKKIGRTLHVHVLIVGDYASTVSRYILSKIIQQRQMSISVQYA